MLLLAFANKGTRPKSFKLHSNIMSRGEFLILVTVLNLALIYVFNHSTSICFLSPSPHILTLSSLLYIYPSPLFLPLCLPASHLSLFSLSAHSCACTNTLALPPPPLSLSLPLPLLLSLSLPLPLSLSLSLSLPPLSLSLVSGCLYQQFSETGGQKRRSLLPPGWPHQWPVYGTSQYCSYYIACNIVAAFYMVVYSMQYYCSSI